MQSAQREAEIVAENYHSKVDATCVVCVFVSLFVGVSMGVCVSACPCAGECAT